MADNARHCAVKALIRLHRENSYSNILWEERLAQAGLPPMDQALATRLFYGVIERRLTLDYLLSRCCSMKLKRLHPYVLDILRVGAYQLLYMEKIPASAAVNEAVKLTRRLGQHKAAGLVNGVLRAVDRDAARVLSALPDTPEGWEIRYSCPRALLEEWTDGYSAERAKDLAQHMNDIPPHFVRVNTLVTTTEKLCEQLDKSGVSYKALPSLPDCLEIPEISLLKRLETLPKNWYYHQDMASQWCCLALGAQPGERIADVCAAPGGKSLTAAQYMQNDGQVYACDAYSAKCEAMERRARELGAAVIQVRTRDASHPCAPDERAVFDRVLCDVPCSGLGVIRRKPEIRYKDPREWDALPDLQYRILEESAAMVKPGGVLQYSTCTLRPQENERVAERFAGAHPEFVPRPLPLKECFLRAGRDPAFTITLFPSEQGTDGFFIASFVKLR